MNESAYLSVFFAFASVGLNLENELSQIHPKKELAIYYRSPSGEPSADNRI